MAQSAVIKHSDGSAGGYLVGRKHSEGGIKAINKSTGQPIEMESDEVVITAPAVKDNKKHDFNGEKLTNLQILSRINESGGGVSLMKDGGFIGGDHTCGCTGKKHKYNGAEMTDWEIASEMARGGHTCGCDHDEKHPAHLLPRHFDLGGVINTDSYTNTEKQIVERFSRNSRGYVSLFGIGNDQLQNLLGSKFIYSTGLTLSGHTDVFPTELGIASFSRTRLKKGGKIEDDPNEVTEIGDRTYKRQFKYFKGIRHNYTSPFDLNKAIEEVIDAHTAENFTMSPEELNFLRYYSGYGGLGKFGAEGKGILWEFYTPSPIAEKMWGLAYKYGYSGGPVCEPAVGVGEFLKYLPDRYTDAVAYEINPYSAKICSLLYPTVFVNNHSFEELFIKNRNTIKDKTGDLKKFSLVIGNPPFGTYDGKYAHMGEKAYTRATNWVEYFINRGLDILEKNGLLIYLVGAEVANGGEPFLMKGMNDAKKRIMQKCKLLDAYRLPNGVFERTDVLSDIIVLQKN